jgi:signal transduction histidine kinase
MRTLRGRLALWHGLVVALALAGFALGAYALVARSLYSEVDHSLQDRAEQVRKLGRRAALATAGRPGAVPPANPFASEDTYVQVARMDGVVRRRSANLGDERLPLDPGLLARLRPGVGLYSYAEVRGQRARVYTTAFGSPGGPPFIVQVARGLDPVERTLGRVRRLAGLGLLGALALSALGVWLAGGRALRPLDRLIETAAAVATSGDLSRRVGGAPAKDEVGKLAATFNAMLARLESSNAELRAARLRAEDALQAQRRFAADASHELRTPLTTIRGNADLLRGYAGLTPEDRAAALAQIQREAERMGRLVNDLLALARADAGQPLRRMPVPLAPLLQDVVSQARGLARGQVVELEVEAPATVQGDPDRLRQLLLILLDNALKATPPGGSVRVGLSSPDGEAVVTVADTGRGIEPGDLPHIFERFYRADRARASGGAGLGLSIALSIATEHGGTIHAESTPGAGATFTVRIPTPPPMTAPGAKTLTVA